ncbi:hypothetical protein P9578_21985 [Brevibacillus choshinensis]|uniref:hypothetical protein n=1 Tax=Brevibacillus choshinensis TaxID=54911 RepID=UPI002E1CFB2A|nr:hypothetical protein [Brevibacillus choshinensis]MED4779074.1 hypothetical protein [Brevibacillus choshinensis]
MLSRLPRFSKTPVAVSYTPGSILNLDNPPLFLVPIPNRPEANRERYGTCTDVGWYNNDRYLAVLNLAMATLHIYAFNKQDHSLELLQTLSNQHGMQLYWPDMLAISKDGKYLAITNTKPGMCSVNIYRIDPHSQLIDPVPFQVLRYHDSIFHGVRFSPDSRYLVCTTTEGSGIILIYRLHQNEGGDLDVILHQVLPNSRYAPFKPKSIDFSGDASLLAICFGPSGGTESYPSYGVLAVYKWDHIQGTLGTEPVCELKEKPELSCPDGISFSHDEESSFLVVQSQSNDTVVFYPFDKKTNQIDPQFVALTNPEAQISFPHGFSLTSDDRYLALSNYGDDKVTIYTLER